MTAKYCLTCSDCGIEFYRKKRFKCRDGKYRCTSCQRTINWDHWYSENKEAYLVRRIKHRHTPIGRAASRRSEKNYRKTEKGKEARKRAQEKRRKSKPDIYRKKYTARKYKIKVETFDGLGDVCQLCGIKENLSIDHIHPVSKGGTNDLSNLQILCGSCNSFKGNRLFLPGGGMIVSM